jgi:hypothetical protein
MHRFNASRSAEPRVTGNPPNAVSSRPKPFDFQYLSAPMNRMRRHVSPDEIGVSRMLRCTGASTNGPSAGMFSRPSTDMRHQMWQKLVTMKRTV